MHGIRHGGGTHDSRHGPPVAETIGRGSWSDPKSATTYFQTSCGPVFNVTVPLGTARRLPVLSRARRRPLQGGGLPQGRFGNICSVCCLEYALDTVLGRCSFPH